MQLANLLNLDVGMADIPQIPHPQPKTSPPPHPTLEVEGGGVLGWGGEVFGEEEVGYSGILARG